MQVVTLDGTLINKAGVMTGGLSRNLESRAQRWDEKVTGNLKEVRDASMFCHFIYLMQSRCMFCFGRVGNRPFAVMQHFDTNLVHELVAQERSRYVRELADLPSERDSAQTEQQLGADIAGVERQACANGTERLPGACAVLSVPNQPARLLCCAM